MEWFQEDLHGEIAQTIRVDEDIYTGRTDLQDVKIFRNDLLGKVLVLDGAVQVTELDEHIYSEMMVHVPLLSHPDPKDVLIIGGGDGTCLREVLRHSTVERAVLAELDGGLIRLCEKHMPEMVRGAYRDPRTLLEIGDGAAFVASSENRFDIVIVDSTDPHGPSEPLFTRQFYEACKSALKPDGILVAQAGCPLYQWDFGAEIGEHLSHLFDYNGYYQAAVPSYLGGLHAFAWGASRDISHIPVRPALDGCSYYSAATRQAGFLLPLPA